MNPRSRQALMNCVPLVLEDGKKDPPPGCNGGDAWMILEYMNRVAVPDETCQPYEARNGQCDAAGVCRNCLKEGIPDSPKGGCWPINSFISYRVEEYGKVSGEVNMMKVQ